MKMAPFLRPMSIICSSAMALGIPALRAFEVAKDVNQPPREEAVLFAKGQPAGHLSFFSTQKNTFAINSEGALSLRIDNNDPIEAGFRWAGGPGLPDSFSVSDYAYVIVTGRLEGANRGPGGTSQRPDKLWCVFALFNEAGENVAVATLSDAAPGGRTPEETVTLAIPMVLFTYWGQNPRPPIHGFGFQWGATRPPTVRDYTLVIERVALAN